MVSSTKENINNFKIKQKKYLKQTIQFYHHNYCPIKIDPDPVIDSSILNIENSSKNTKDRQNDTLILKLDKEIEESEIISVNSVNRTARIKEQEKIAKEKWLPKLDRLTSELTKLASDNTQTASALLQQLNEKL